MHIEKHLKTKGKLFYFIKNIGILRFVPIFMLDVIAAALILLSFLARTDAYELESDLLMISQYFFPLFSVWWSVFVLREFIEADGKEVFYAAGLTNIMLQALKPFLLLLANVYLIMLVCTAAHPAFAVELIRITAACVFYFGLVYFVSMCFKSTAISMFCVIIYTLFCAVVRSSEIRFPIFMSVNVMDGEAVLKLCLPLFLLGLLLIFAGRITEKRFFCN